MNRSEQLNELFTGMFKLKGKLNQPKTDASVDYRNKNGSSTNFKYATLKAITEAIYKASQESDSGIDFQQNVINDDEMVSVTTIIHHISGQYMEHGPLVFRSKGLGPQNLGSLITYARRYSLASAFGIAADEDDDGNIATDGVQNQRTNHSDHQQKNQQVSKRNELRTVDSRQLLDLREHAKEYSDVSGIPVDEVLATIAEMGHVQSIEQLLADHFIQAKSELIKMRSDYIRKTEQQAEEITWGEA